MDLHATARRRPTGPRLLILVPLLAAGAVALSRPAAGQGFLPDEAAARMTVDRRLKVELVASEPLVRQPVCVEFDDRGRLWVIQYLQYPNPNGLKRVQVDRFSRTRYDRTPKPPPEGPRGADRITILEDTDGDGRLDRGKDFVAGLNLTTGLAFGHGGVYVLNVPYLLFYPDEDRDDVPDGDPQVLLSGFGMEDAHSVANSLTWGPDGWLYGCQGSTVTANIRGIEFQQGVWRFHPVTHAFELFCEGGGNAWGLDFDPLGNLLYSTNYGGHVLAHGVQGGYYVKSFAKHGELHNRFAYGYFPHAPHRDFQGGHVTVGGIVYRGGALPEAFDGKYLAGDLLGHGVYWHDVSPWGATFRTAHGGELLRANDAWFAPTDVTLGPDGAIYVADWHDQRTAHPDPDAEWDRSNGRIYRISAREAASPPSSQPGWTDVVELSVDQLLARLQSPNPWRVRRARVELARRAAKPDAAPLSPDQLQPLRAAACGDPSETAALNSLWTIHAAGALDAALAERLLASPHAAVRAWTVRLLSDPGQALPEPLARQLDQLAEREPSLRVRQQLASTAQRLPPRQALPIINSILNRDIDHDDPFLPLLWWWAVERHSVEGREDVLRRFVRPSLWQSRLGREVLLPRLVRRYVAEATRAGFDSAARLLQSAPNSEARDRLWASVEQGWLETPRPRDAAAEATPPPGHALAAMIREAWLDQPGDLTLLHLGILLNQPEPRAAALQEAADETAAAPRRAAVLQRLADAPGPDLVDPLFKILNAASNETVWQAALQTLSRADDPRIDAGLLQLLQRQTSADFKARLRDALLARKRSALLFLRAVERGEIAPQETSLEQIRRVNLFADPQLDALVTRHWGKVAYATPEEKLAEVRRLNNDVRAAPGDKVAGRAVFKKHCAACHQLFGEGQKVGPDLTTANRADRQYLLVSLVDPSSVIRKEYLSVVLRTTDGRVLTGMPIAHSDGILTLMNGKQEKIAVADGEIQEMRESELSLMPEDLYRQLSPQQLRDLFAFLQSK